MIKCKSCNIPIIKKSDLVVVLFFFRFETYHRECYEKSMVSGYLPVNSKMSSIVVLISLLFASYIFTMVGVTFVGNVLTIYPLIRLLSFIMFERKLGDE